MCGIDVLHLVMKVVLWYKRQMSRTMIPVKLLLPSLPVLLMILLGCASNNAGPVIYDEAKQEVRDAAVIEKLNKQQDTVAVFVRGLC